MIVVQWVEVSLDDARVNTWVSAPSPAAVWSPAARGRCRVKETGNFHVDGGISIGADGRRSSEEVAAAHTGDRRRRPSAIPQLVARNKCIST